MIRRLLVLCALAALASGPAYGVELGKLQLHSALNQRLDADIPLTNVEGLGTDEILPGLASPEEFDRMGIDRPYELTDLRFTVRQGQNGQMEIHITSTNPIVEPYLDFLMEVLWPNGRIVHEYTVLLNPPVYGKSGIHQLNAPSVPTQAAQARRKPAPATTAQAAPTPSAPPPMTSHMGEGSMSNGKYGVTGPGDTLWKIAEKVRPNRSVSIQQTMLAIKRANPGDFINDNINLLRAGRVLRIPNLQEIQRESFASAVQEVKSQNEAFHTYKRGGSMRQINAAPRNAAANASGGGTGSNKGSGELRLLTAHNTSGNSSSAAKGGNATASEQALQDQLDTTREDLDKAKRANTDLGGRVNDLQQQIKTLNHLVKLKDDQLATLRAAVQKMQSAQKTQAANPAATPVVTTQGSQGSLLTNPYVLIGLVLVLVGGVAGGLIFMRRRRQSDDMEAVEFVEEVEPEEEHEEETSDEAEPALSLEHEDEELSPQTSDVIGEAEIYIAYGRFPQAITFLQNAIEAEPTRSDIRLKLLEVYSQTEDVDAFDEQLAELQALGDEDAIGRARALRGNLPGGEILEEAPLSAAGDAVASDSADDDLSFDLDDLDAETEETTLDLSNDLDLEDEMDLDLDLDGEAEAESEPELTLDDSDLDLDLTADSSEDDLGDLDMDLDLDQEDEEAGVISLDEADLEDADLDLEAAAADDDGAIELSMDDDEIDAELSMDDDELDLEAESSLDEGEIDLGSELNLDDATEDEDLALDDGEIELNLDDDDALDLDLDAEEDAALDLSGAEGGLDLDDDDEFELNLDEDASTKLDLARAYIDMGDSDGARNVLQEVIEEGSDEEIQEANELLAKIG